MSEKRKRVEVTCPCCEATLKIDPASGLVVSSQAKKSEYSFETALEREESRKSKADDLFEQAFKNEKQRTAQMKKKFKEALRSTDELEDPARPFDFD